jgi:adenosylcobinamide kinase/adenosylcobinamide-phosphate guanylyltransferase
MNSQQAATQEHSSPRLILILGGARSGKSSFAEHLATTSGRSVAFIATATASDNEMHTRITNHRASRPATWLTIEEPLDLAKAVQQAAQVADVLLLDCMTLWLSNWLWRDGEINFDEDATEGVRSSIEALAAVERLVTVIEFMAIGKTLIVVSNEVGLGIVPEYAAGRAYRDIMGRVNQRLAQQAEQVYLMVAGLAVDIKRLHEEASL